MRKNTMRLHELRRNPELNTKETFRDTCKKYAGQDVVIHFTNGEKVGLHPRYKNRHTFLGLYGYPLDYILGVMDHPRAMQRPENLFAANRTYVYFLQNTSTAVLDSSTYKRDNLKIDLEKLGLSSDVMSTAHPFEQLLNIVRTQFAGDPRKAFKVNYKLRNLGYEVVKDYIGAISSDIPVEAVFLTSKAYKVINMIQNDLPEREKRVWNHLGLYQLPY